MFAHYRLVDERHAEHFTEPRVVEAVNEVLLFMPRGPNDLDPQREERFYAFQVDHLFGVEAGWLPVKYSILLEGDGDFDSIAAECDAAFAFITMKMTVDEKLGFMFLMDRAIQVTLKCSRCSLEEYFVELLITFQFYDGSKKMEKRGLGSHRAVLIHDILVDLFIGIKIENLLLSAFINKRDEIPLILYQLDFPITLRWYDKAELGWLSRFLEECVQNVDRHRYDISGTVGNKFFWTWLGTEWGEQWIDRLVNSAARLKKDRSLHAELRRSANMIADLLWHKRFIWDEARCDKLERWMSFLIEAQANADTMRFLFSEKRIADKIGIEVFSLWIELALERQYHVLDYTFNQDWLWEAVSRERMRDWLDRAVQDRYYALRLVNFFVNWHVIRNQAGDSWWCRWAEQLLVHFAVPAADPDVAKLREAVGQRCGEVLRS